MDSCAVRQFLARFPQFEVKPGLERIRCLMDALSSPQCCFPAVHVTGTNGKGSVVAMLDAVLRAAGLCIGRYTSPELIDFRDRITVNGVWISEREMACGLERMADVLARMEDRPSQFEVITALALDLFARRAVDLAVVEVGLGGRFDATNVVRSEVCLVTNVTLDHQHLLGSTEEAIAWEKAGIVKAGSAVLTGALSPAVEQIVRAECAACGAELVEDDVIRVQRIARDWASATYHVQGFAEIEQLEIPLLGGRQAENLRLVLRTVLVLRSRGLSIPASAVADGLRSVFWPGRFEVLRRDPTVVLDGAHNPAGISGLIEDVAAMVPCRQNRSLLFGILKDKDVEEALRLLATVFPTIGVCASGNPRAVPVEELADRASVHFARVAAYATVEDGMASWVSNANVDEVLVVAGSLSVVAQARRRGAGARCDERRSG